jgi:hypothetical protein
MGKDNVMVKECSVTIPTKNPAEPVIVSASVYQGKEYIAIRKYYTDDFGEQKPGKQGINLPFEKIDELIAALQTVLEEQDGS